MKIRNVLYSLFFVSVFLSVIGMDVDARYYDPRLGRWISVDRALQDYLPDRRNPKHKSNDFIPQRDLPGMGGVYTPFNLNLYQYSFFNPIRYVDPDGNQVFTSRYFWGAEATRHLMMSEAKTPAERERVANTLAHQYMTSARVTAIQMAMVSTGYSIMEISPLVVAQIGVLGGPTGFKTFQQLKNAIGRAGDFRAWHHIVEQTDSNIARFGPERIHNLKNVVNMESGFSGSLHNQISGYYSSIQFFTNGVTVREWLSTKSFEFQYKFGVDTINQFAKRAQSK